MQKIVDELLARFGKDFAPKDWQRVGANKEKFVGNYIGRVDFDPAEAASSRYGSGR